MKHLVNAKGIPYLSKMDKRISILEKTQTVNEVGGVVVGFNTLFETWAYYEDRSGGEVEQEKLVHLINGIFYIRKRHIVLEKSNELVVLYNGKKYSIYHVVEVDQDFLKIMVAVYE